MLGRGDLLAVDDAIRTALGVVRIGLRCGAGKLLGLAAREPGAEPQAPPQPFARLPGEPHRCLPLMPTGAGKPFLHGSRQIFPLSSIRHWFPAGECWPQMHLPGNAWRRCHNSRKSGGYRWRSRRSITLAGKSTRIIVPTWTKLGLLP